MTYRIEITAETMTELGGKLLALASQFHTTAADPVMPEIREPAKAKRPKKEAEPEVADAGEPSTSETSAPSSNTSTPSAETSTPTPEPSASEPLNFDTDVAPVILEFVAAKGKPAASEILSQFGVERASQMDPARWPELVDMLKEAL